MRSLLILTPRSAARSSQRLSTFVIVWPRRRLQGGRKFWKTRRRKRRDKRGRRRGKREKKRKGLWKKKKKEVEMERRRRTTGTGGEITLAVVEAHVDHQGPLVDDIADDPTLVSETTGGGAEIGTGEGTTRKIPMMKDEGGDLAMDDAVVEAPAEAPGGVETAVTEVRQGDLPHERKRAKKKVWSSNLPCLMDHRLFHLIHCLLHAILLA
mmetsp:Transcript_39358/g.100903  ORF Transcript_39358/g.100903 Transcript_39358/m.100903 type:complete len:210 (-) Transcript_39358:732-1361(-)